MNAVQQPARQVVLVGLGMVAKVYIEALRQLAPAITLRGVLGSTEKSSAQFCLRQRSQFDHELIAYADIEAVAADDEVDFVLVATPPDARLALSEILSRAGKPVLMEKPVERNLANATKIVETYAAKRVPLGIMFQHRTRPSCAALQKLLRERAPGPLVTAEISVPWWRDQAYYDQPGRGSYARDGGGVLISQAIHTLDLLLWFAGPVTKVQAFCATSDFHQMEAEDFVSAGLEFDNGAVGTLFATTASYPGRSEELILHYRHVTARLQSNLLKICWHDGKRETFGAQAATGAGADPMAFSCDWHKAMIEDFNMALSAKRPPLVDGQSALTVHRLIEALEQSGKSGQVQQL